MTEDLYFYTYRKCFFPLDNSSLDESRFCLLGIPFDSTQTGKTGSRYGPTSIRLASYDLETFDISTGTDLSTVRLHDIGDVDCVPGSPELTMERIGHTCKNMPDGKLLIALGGEHSVSLPLIKAARPEMVVSFDAHPDLREDYMGVKLSHSCVMRRAHESGASVEILGVREGSREEYEYSAKNGIRLIPPEQLGSWDAPRDKDIYISIDLDVFDNVDVGNPMPGGLHFNETCNMLKAIVDKNNIVGLDIVELCSQPDDASSYFAAKLLYRIISYLSKKP